MADRLVLAPLITNSLLHHHHHHHHPHNRKRRVKRLSSASLLPNSNSAAYYPSAFITNPCDQLFGPPQPFDCELDTSKTSQTDKSFANTSLGAETSTHSTDTHVDNENRDEEGPNESVAERFEYIPTPKWTKIQNSVLEELFKKSRYPKANELKSLAQKFHVMDSDIEEWFRKRRGRDRKIKRKNEVLKNLIDNYIDK